MAINQKDITALWVYNMYNTITLYDCKYVCVYVWMRITS